jgi:hypothetical protein
MYEITVVQYPEADETLYIELSGTVRITVPEFFHDPANA